MSTRHLSTYGNIYLLDNKFLLGRTSRVHDKTVNGLKEAFVSKRFIKIEAQNRQHINSCCLGLIRLLIRVYLMKQLYIPPSVPTQSLETCHAVQIFFFLL